MANEENYNKRPYDYNNDELFKKLLNKTSKDNQLNNMGDDFFIKVADANYKSAKQQETAKVAQNSRGQKPVTPEKVSVPRKSKYVYEGTMVDKKKNKLPKSLSIILAAAIAIGGISAITLGIKHVQNNARDNALANSQQSLGKVTYKDANLSELNTYQSQNNNLLILNANLNSLLESYKKDPHSVTQEEVAQLLSVSYQEGREIVFSKVADAYNNYSQENDEFPETIDSDHLVYWNSKDVGHYHVAYQANNANNTNGKAIAYDNDKLTKYITEQEKIHDLYEFNSETNTLRLKDGTTIEKAINSLVIGVTDTNEIASSNFHFEKGLMGKTLKIDALENNKTNTATNKDNSNAQAINIDYKDDLGDEER